MTAFGSHQCGLGSHESQRKSYMWVELVAGFLLCTERVFPGFQNGLVLASS